MNESRTLKVERSTSTAHRLLNYDGACGNVHGHNMDWEVDARISMEGVGDDNMPVDLKDISSTIDQVDHAICLNADDGLAKTEPQRSPDNLGDLITFEGDPTCEVLSQWMAKQIYHIDEAVQYVNVTVYETDKYGIQASYSEMDEMEELREQKDDS